MLRQDFDPTRYRASGTYCSDPCIADGDDEGCPVAKLVAGTDIEAAITVDEVFVRHGGDLSQADNDTIDGWVAAEHQFTAGFLSDFPIELDVVADAIARIKEGHCPNYQ